MPRNDQLIRQWHLLRSLESKRGRTLQELVEAVPEDYRRHPRTVRRDLEALEAAGFPLVTDRIDGQTRWKLMDGYGSIPSPSFSPTELMALAFSRKLLKPLEGTHLRAALDSALNKAVASLPAPSASYVAKLQDLFTVRLGPHKRYEQHRATIDLLTEAIARSRTVQMRYYSASRNATSRREVDPYRLWYAGGALYLIAYDHLRSQIRIFSVDRIRSLVLTDHPYQMPLGFDVQAYLRDALLVMRGEPIAVELLFDKRTARWVGERSWHPSQALTPLKDGRLRMTLKVADTPELVGWILSFGGGVKVLRPAELKARVQQEAMEVVRSCRQ